MAKYSKKELQLIEAISENIEKAIKEINELSNRSEVFRFDSNKIILSNSIELSKSIMDDIKIDNLNLINKLL